MWDNDQQFEANWWGNCTNTLGEEIKQLIYADKMGIKTFHDGKSPYNFDLKGNVLDMGGGPTSMLLRAKCGGLVVDPCDYPKWIIDRYEIAGIRYEKLKGEDFITDEVFDIALCYNVLQHVEDPVKVVENIKNCSKEVRVFEWIENGISPGHPHNLTEKKLDKWLGGIGKVGDLNGEGTCVGKYYAGIFIGNK